jgi:pyruvate/2-oxoglutarate dehydrogenase complex dihydrolipoamide dehydrogenase (E3) component
LYYINKNNSKLEKVFFDEILISAGRSPNVKGMGLEIANIDYNDNGIVVNDYLNTSNSSIYAVGDCCFKYQFTHAADFTARLVIRNSLFFGLGKASDLLGINYFNNLVPWFLF